MNRIPTVADVYGSLCWYDRRNPSYVEEGETAPRQPGCACDPCFHGKDLLAMEILRLRPVIEIEVMGRRAAERRQFSANEAVISIISPKQPHVALDGAATVLRLQFDDAEPLHGDMESERTEAWKRPAILFTPSMAADVLAFAARVVGEGKRLVVHCEAGLSRSAGIAAALDAIFNTDRPYLSYDSIRFANAHVKAALMEHARVIGMLPRLRGKENE